MKKSFAFTLAEVLITLGIIGVVAAMTIPTLMNKTNDAEMKTGLKKAYSILSQVTKQVAYEQGGTWPDTDTVYANLAGKFSVSKDCTNNAGTGYNEGGCWYGLTYLDSSTTTVKFLDGSNLADGGLWPTGGMTLSDGMLLSVAFLQDGIADIANHNACTYTSSTVTKICSAFMMDVNGNKKPNVVGKDVYLFYVKENGVLKPFGNTDDGHENTCIATSTGVGCAAKYLAN